MLKGRPMSDTTLVLSLPLIQPAQAQKHITHNESLARLDLLTQLAVASRSLNAPPEDAAEGDRFIVAPEPTGPWAGHADDIAILTDAGWQFTAPLPGWQALVLDETAAVFWNDGWLPLADPQPVVERLGVGTTPDAGNPLAVSGAATLLTHAGGGHQLKVNKAAATDTASLLFQTGWSGRAEMGLAGEDAFSVKVSADGNTFRTALRADPASGAVTLPAGLTVEGPVTGKGVMQSTTDTKAGRLMPVGAFGLGRGAGAGVPLPKAAPSGLFVQAASADPAGRGQERAVLSAAGAAHPSGLFSWAMVQGAAHPLFGVSATDGSVTWEAGLTRASAVGKVAATPTAATPAILEHGGSGDAQYLRLADGTQICWGIFRTSDVPVQFTYAGGYRSAGQAVSFAARFVDTPAVTTACADLAASDALCAGAASVTATGFAAYLWRATQTGASRLTGSYVAVGRWA